MKWRKEGRKEGRKEWNTRYCVGVIDNSGWEEVVKWWFCGSYSIVVECTLVFGSGSFCDNGVVSEFLEWVSETKAVLWGLEIQRRCNRQCIGIGILGIVNANAGCVVGSCVLHGCVHGCVHGLWHWLFVDTWHNNTTQVVSTGSSSTLPMPDLRNLCLAGSRTVAGRKCKWLSLILSLQMHDADADANAEW